MRVIDSGYRLVYQSENGRMIVQKLRLIVSTCTTVITNGSTTITIDQAVTTCDSFRRTMIGYS